MPKNMNQALNRAATLWCEVMHDSPMWPIHGQYECRTCGRLYHVAWAFDRNAPAQPTRQAQFATFRSAILPSVVLLAMVGATVGRADLIIHKYPCATPVQASEERYI